MKDGSFVTHVKCGFTWFVLSSTEPPEVNGAATHVYIAIGNCDKHAASITFARVAIYIALAMHNCDYVHACRYMHH